MNKLLLTLALVGSLIAPCVLANDPSMMNNTPSTSTPGRKQWVKHRRSVLQGNREHYENEKGRYKLLMNPLGGEPMDAVEMAKFRIWEAQTKRVRNRQTVEELMLKRESGDITPAENAALNKFLQRRARGR